MTSDTLHPVRLLLYGCCCYTCRRICVPLETTAPLGRRRRCSALQETSAPRVSLCPSGVDLVSSAPSGLRRLCSALQERSAALCRRSAPHVPPGALHRDSLSWDMQGPPRSHHDLHRPTPSLSHPASACVCAPLAARSTIAQPPCRATHAPWEPSMTWLGLRLASPAPLAPPTLR